MSAATTAPKTAVRLLQGFDDPRFGAADWERLLDRTGCDVVYMTPAFQRAWWETLGGGELLLIAAERDGEPFALAPMYADEGMVYLLGSAFDSDYLDFVGDISPPGTLEAMLDTARQLAPGFCGFRFYFIQESTGTGERLQAAAKRLGLGCYREHDMQAPIVDLVRERALVETRVSAPKLMKRERFFRRNGELTVRSLRDGREILPHLPILFEQHVARRGPETPNPSRFLREGARRLFERFTIEAADTGRLRYTLLEWDGRPIAQHYGYRYRGRYYWGASGIDVELAARSPGQVLLRHVLLEAMAEGARTFDFGPGEAPFKLRYATTVRPLHTWGIYPRES